MILFGEDKYIPALKEMWKLCFLDEDSFIDFYFDQVYKNEETLVYLENGIPAAAFQMIPYSLKNGAETFPAGYISGAMTHPDFRRKGFMRDLLFSSFDIMRERGFDYTFLIPQEEWLFDFYRKFGYKETKEVNWKPARHCEDEVRSNPVKTNNLDCFTASQFAMTDATIYQTYFRFLSKILQVVLKTETQFKQILYDFFNNDGVLFASEQGIAFTFKGKKQIMVKEFFYQNQKVKDMFLKGIQDYYAKEKVKIISSSEKLSGTKGMIKRLNDEKPEISALYISMMMD